MRRLSALFAAEARCGLRIRICFSTLGAIKFSSCTQELIIPNVTKYVALNLIPSHNTLLWQIFAFVLHSINSAKILGNNYLLGFLDPPKSHTELDLTRFVFMRSHTIC